MESATSVEFSRSARAVADAARDLGLVVPGFRSPPRLVGVSRTIRRRAGPPVVSVAVRDRPAMAVLADMIEGVVVANGLAFPEADRARTGLWAASLETAPADRRTAGAA